MRNLKVKGKTHFLCIFFIFLYEVIDQRKIHGSLPVHLWRFCWDIHFVRKSNIRDFRSDYEYEIEYEYDFSNLVSIAPNNHLQDKCYESPYLLVSNWKDRQLWGHDWL